MGTKLVGFGDGVWSGGAFESGAETLEGAAREVYERHGAEFINGKGAITHVFVTDFDARQAATYRVESGEFILEAE